MGTPKPSVSENGYLLTIVDGVAKWQPYKNIPNKTPYVDVNGVLQFDKSSEVNNK